MPPADTTSVEDLVSLRRALNKEISVANMAASMGVQDAPTRQRALQKVKDALDQSFAKLEGEQNGNFGEKFKKLSAQWKTQYFDVFKRGTGGKMAREGYMGEIVDDGKIISQLVMTPGSGEGMRGMLEVIGGDPAGIKALHAGIIDKLVQGKEGALTQRQLDAFLSTHREALAQVPELRDRLTKLSGAYEEIATAKRGLLAEQKAHDASELAKAADKPVEEVIKTVLSNSKQLESTMAQMKTPSMKASLARAIADHVTQQPEPLKYLQEKELVLKPVLDQLGKDHWKNVSLIADAAEIQKRVKAPTVARLPGRGEQTIDLHDIPRTTHSIVGALARGAAKILNQTTEEERAAFERTAIYDPSFANTYAKLLRAPTWENWRRMHYAAAQAGIGKLSDLPDIAVVGNKSAQGAENIDANSVAQDYKAGKIDYNTAAQRLRALGHR